MKKVVIIGGGFTGTQCAKDLQKDGLFSVTLIDTKSYFEFTPSILRTILEPEHEKKIQVLHKDYLKKAKVVVGKVTEISKDKVWIGKKSWGFDYLIIASGSSYSVPIKEEGLVPATRAKELTKYHDKLKEAKKVLVIGGGLVGVELVAEIATHYKNKEVTIVQSHEELMERNHVKTRKYAERFLKKHGVKIIFGERAEEKSENYFITDKGTKIESDIAFLCVGINPNYEFMKKNFSKNLNEKNMIQVNDCLQLSGNPHVFVGGDIAGTLEEKVAQTAEKHSEIICRNIRNLESGKKLVEYEKRKRPMLISLGKWDGVLEKDDFVVFGLVPSFLKWFVERKTMWKYRV